MHLNRFVDLISQAERHCLFSVEVSRRVHLFFNLFDRAPGLLGIDDDDVVFKLLHVVRHLSHVVRVAPDTGADLVDHHHRTLGHDDLRVRHARDDRGRAHGRAIDAEGDRALVRLEKRIDRQARVHRAAKAVDRNLKIRSLRDATEILKKLSFVEAFPPRIILRAADIPEQVEFCDLARIVALYVPKLIHPFPPSPLLS